MCVYVHVCIYISVYDIDWCHTYIQSLYEVSHERLDFAIQLLDFHRIMMYFNFRYRLHNIGYFWRDHYLACFKRITIKKMILLPLYKEPTIGRLSHNSVNHVFYYCYLSSPTNSNLILLPSRYLSLLNISAILQAHSERDMQYFFSCLITRRLSM